MSDETVTVWKTRVLRAWVLCVQHRDYSIPVATFFIGWLIGKVL